MTTNRPDLSPWERQRARRAEQQRNKRAMAALCNGREPGKPGRPPEPCPLCGVVAPKDSDRKCTSCGKRAIKKTRFQAVREKAIQQAAGALGGSSRVVTADLAFGAQGTGFPRESEAIEQPVTKIDLGI